MRDDAAVYLLRSHHSRHRCFLSSFWTYLFYWVCLAKLVKTHWAEFWAPGEFSNLKSMLPRTKRHSVFHTKLALICFGWKWLICSLLLILNWTWGSACLPLWTMLCWRPSNKTNACLWLFVTLMKGQRKIFALGCGCWWIVNEVVTPMQKRSFALGPLFGRRKAVFRGGKLSGAYRFTEELSAGPNAVSENSARKLSLPIQCRRRSRLQLSFMYICPHYTFWGRAAVPEDRGYCLSLVHSRLAHLPNALGEVNEGKRCDLSVRYSSTTSRPTTVVISVWSNRKNAFGFFSDLNGLTLLCICGDSFWSCSLNWANCSCKWPVHRLMVGGLQREIFWPAAQLIDNW